MHSIISIVGKSGSGKTTLLESLIAELKKRGHQVAIVKHSHHKDDLDRLLTYKHFGLCHTQHLL